MDNEQVKSKIDELHRLAAQTEREGRQVAQLIEQLIGAVQVYEDWLCCVLGVPEVLDMFRRQGAGTAWAPIVAWYDTHHQRIAQRRQEQHEAAVAAQVEAQAAAELLQVEAAPVDEAALRASIAEKLTPDELLFLGLDEDGQS